ncbi:MAG TPA: hypothetical protein VFF49_06600 [Thermodesulfobacteriota bacterium]|nr:hypothetical protein [Thermodesulfobacteriota bacterium]
MTDKIEQGLEKYKAIQKSLKSQGAVEIGTKSEPAVLAFRVIPDIKKNSVVLEFNQVIKFVGFTVAQARVLAQALRQASNVLEKNIQNATTEATSGNIKPSDKSTEKTSGHSRKSRKRHARNT